MSDRDADRRRRDLYAVSVALLLYNLAGGSFAGTAATYFGSIQVARPWVLTAGAWLLWAYFGWRFWLAATPIWAAFRRDFDIEALRSPAHKSYTKAFLAASAKRLREEADDARAFGSRPEAMIGFARAHDSALEAGYLLEIERDCFAAKVSIGLADRNGEVRLFLPEIPERLRLELDATVPWRGRARNVVLAQAIRAAVLRQHAFSDGVLPMAVATAAPLVAILRCLWNLAR